MHGHSIMDKHTSEFEPNNYPLNQGRHILEASAGTGKTFSLAHLVLRLLTEKKYKITEILVISFTKATASEIKSKISTRLLLALKGLENFENDLAKDNLDEVLIEWLRINCTDKEKRVNWAGLILSSLENIDSADITTIHGFCSRNIKREAAEIGYNINSHLLTEKENKELIVEVVDEYWRKQLLPLNALHLKGLMKAGLSSKALARSLGEIDSDPSINFKVDVKGIDCKRPIYEQFNSYFQSYLKNFINCWEEDGEELEQELQKKSITWKEIGITNTKPFSGKPIRKRSLEIKEWIDQYRQIKAKGSEDSNNILYYCDIRNNQLLRDYFHPIKISEIERRNRLDESPLIKPKLQTAIANLWDMPAEMVWQHALYCCLKKLKKKKDQNGVENFSDQIMALDPNSSILNSHSKNLLLHKLRKRYKAVLVDEFQDTDPIQWRIINKAFGESKKHLLVLVGDPKQSIYKFRGGDLETYLKAKEIVDRTDSLLTNFRSTPELLDGLNTLMRNGLIYSGLHVPYLNSSSKETALFSLKKEAPIDIINLNIKSSKTIEESMPSKSEVDAHIPIVVTNSIFELMDNYSDQITLEDICILVNSHQQAESIRKRLLYSNLPCKLINQGDILNSQAAKNILLFLNCLANPKDSRYIRLLACSPLLQWDINKIKDLDHSNDIDILISKCISWSERLETIGLLGCLSEVLESTNIANIYMQGRMLGDLKQCAEIVEEAIHNLGLNAKKAARWLNQQSLEQTEIVPENRRSNSDTEEKAINIITIHRSKGLQFKVVICPYLWQSAPIPKGPLWKTKESQDWFLSLTTGWGENSIFLQESIKELREESERLAYVALTRAQKKLIVIWALAKNQEDNPLRNLLFDNSLSEYSQNELTESRMNEWTSRYNSNINIKTIENIKTPRLWELKNNNSSLTTGPIPKRKLDEIWGRYSYSSWTTKTKEEKILADNAKEEEVEKETELTDGIYESVSSNSIKDRNRSNHYSKSPLADFPRGSNAGNCLHRILEKLDFQLPVTSDKTELLIIEELENSGIKKEFKEAIEETLYRVLNIPLGHKIGNIKLHQVSKDRCIKELNFDLSMSDKGNPIKTRDLINVFERVGGIRFGNQYIESLEDLNISSRGFLTGSIDLVFTDNEDIEKAQWWILDWKSNWIGEKTSDKDKTICGPDYYSEKDMKKQMMMHHYPLQAYLYLVALHRFLKWRLKNYVPEVSLGGYIYLFLRGLAEKSEIDNKSNNETPGIFLEYKPIELVLELDKLIKNGGM